MNPKKLALGAASVLAAGAIIGGGARPSRPPTHPLRRRPPPGASADSGSASGTAGQGRQMGGTHTDVTGDGGPRRSSTPSRPRDSTVTIDKVQKGDGSYDASGTKADGTAVRYDVSADLATITEGQGGHGGKGRRLPRTLRSPVTRRRRSSTPSRPRTRAPRSTPSARTPMVPMTRSGRRPMAPR